MRWMLGTSAVMTLLAGCGGGSIAEEGSGGPAIASTQTYRNCRYEFVHAGLTPSMYTYRCSLVGVCDKSDPCLFANDSTCIPNQTTCVPCVAGRAC